MADLSGTRPPLEPEPRAAGRPARIPRLAFAFGVVTLPFVIGAAAYGFGIPAAVLIAAIPLAFLGLRRAENDAVTVLIVFSAVALLIPATQVFTPLKSVGNPATLIGVGCLWLWVMGRLIPRLGLASGPQPVRLLVFAWALANLVSVVMAQLRAIDGVEISAGDRGLILIMSAMGVTLLAADGIVTRRRLETLVEWVVRFGTGAAAIGVIQFVTGYKVADLIRVPGLGPLDVAEYSDIRSEFTRIAGATTHAIEFSVALCMLLPLALYLAFNAAGPKRRWWWASVVLLASGIPMTVSRSGFVGAVVVLAVLLPSWPRARQYRMLLGIVVYLMAMRALFPGLLGTIKSLFLNMGNDPSTQSREQDYTFVADFFGQSPWTGRGFGTFIPTRYDFIDNQYLVTLVEVGIVGLIAYTALWLGGIVVATGVRRRSPRITHARPLPIPDRLARGRAGHGDDVRLPRLPGRAQPRVPVPRLRRRALAHRALPQPTPGVARRIGSQPNLMSSPGEALELVVTFSFDTWSDTVRVASTPSPSTASPSGSPPIVGSLACSSPTRGGAVPGRSFGASKGDERPLLRRRPGSSGPSASEGGTPPRSPGSTRAIEPTTGSSDAPQTRPG